MPKPFPSAASADCSPISPSRATAPSRNPSATTNARTSRRTPASPPSRTSPSAGITTLADISIYTLEGELKLKEVFLKLQSVLGDADAPSSKDDVSKIKALFDKAVPDYDGDRFYVSHMKKVVDWYNELKNYASLDFVEEEEEAAEPEA